MKACIFLKMCSLTLSSTCNVSALYCHIKTPNNQWELSKEEEGGGTGVWEQVNLRDGWFITISFHGIMTLPSPCNQVIAKNQIIWMLRIPMSTPFSNVVELCLHCISHQKKKILEVGSQLPSLQHSKAFSCTNSISSSLCHSAPWRDLEINVADVPF